MTWPKIVTKLAEIDLDDHAPKFKELGFDSMEAFDTSDKGALEIIADMIGLKPGHKVKFVKKFYEQTEAAPPTTPPTAIPIATPAYTVVNLHKAESSTRTGISLVNTANDKLKVESVGEGGVAHGLVAPGDVIIQINDMPAPKNHNEATGMLKALAGDIKLIVHKQAVSRPASGAAQSSSLVRHCRTRSFQRGQVYSMQQRSSLWPLPQPPSQRRAVARLPGRRGPGPARTDAAGPVRTTAYADAAGPISSNAAGPVRTTAYADAAGPISSNAAGPVRTTAYADAAGPGSDH